MHKKLKESEKMIKIITTLVEKEKSINIHKSLIKEKIISNSKSRDGDWSNLNFKRIEFTKIKILLNSESTKIKPDIGFLIDYIKKFFLIHLKIGRKKSKN